MHTAAIWRRSDTRLVRKAFFSFLIIFVLGLIISGLYFLNPPLPMILGTSISNSSGK